MPGTTSRGYRYPVSSDPVNVNVDIQNLATDVNTDAGANVTIFNNHVAGSLHVARGTTVSNAVTGSGNLTLNSVTVTVPATCTLFKVTWNILTSGASSSTIYACTLNSVSLIGGGRVTAGHNLGGTACVSTAVMWLAAPSTGASLSLVLTTSVALSTTYTTQGIVEMFV